MPSLDSLVGGPGTGPAFSSPGNGLKCLRQNKRMERDNRAARLRDCAPCVLVLLAVLSQRCGITVTGYPRLLVRCCSFVSPSNGGVRPRQLYLETRTILSATSDNTDKMNGNPPPPVLARACPNMATPCFPPIVTSVLEGGWAGSIMVGNRYWMPPPRQFQPMLQVSTSNQTAMLHPVAKIQLDMDTIGPAEQQMRGGGVQWGVTPPPPPPMVNGHCRTSLPPPPPSPLS